MGQYRSLFLICDASGRATPAFERAGALAAASGAAVHLGLFDHSPAIAWIGRIDHDRMELLRESFLGLRRASVEALANRLVARGIHASGGATWARPAHVPMLEQIRSLQPDLVIKDARDEPLLLKRMLFTPTDWHLLRHCPVPLFLVRDNGAALPRRIIVAVDPGPHEPAGEEVNERIVRAALSLAIQAQAEVHLVFALDTIAELGPALAGPPGAFSAEALHGLLTLRTDAFATLAAHLGVPMERLHLLQGPPGPAIADFATRWDADAIVVGTAQRGGLERWVMGSSAEQILDHAPCSVLAVPPGRVGTSTPS